MEEVLPRAPEIPGARCTVPALRGQEVIPAPGNLHIPAQGGNSRVASHLPNTTDTGAREGWEPSAGAMPILAALMARVCTMEHFVLPVPLRRKAQDCRTFGLVSVGLVFSVRQSFFVL